MSREVLGASSVRSASDAKGHDPLLLSAFPAGRNQVRLATVLVVGMVAALAITVPFAREPLTGTEVLLPAYAAAICVNELITSALLLALFSVERSRAVLVLAAGYLFSGFTVVPWALTFPGVFPVLGSDEGLQTTAAIAALRRLGFPLFRARLCSAKRSGACAWLGAVDHRQHRGRGRRDRVWSDMAHHHQ